MRLSCTRFSRHRRGGAALEQVERLVDIDSSGRYISARMAVLAGVQSSASEVADGGDEHNAGSNGNHRQGKIRIMLVRADHYPLGVSVGDPVRLLEQSNGCAGGEFAARVSEGTALCNKW